MDSMIPGAAVSAAPLPPFENSEMVLMYREALSDVATYIIMADDPDLPPERRLHWARVLAMVRSDIALAAAPV